MTLRVLLAIRTAAIVATIVLLFVAWLVPAWNARFVIVARRVTVASGFGAQFAVTGITVARGREPWTRFVIPIVGAILSIEALATHALALWSFGVVGAIEASIVAWVVVSANIYAMVWGIGLYATFRTRPHRIVGDTLHLAFGVFRTADIPLAHIAAAHVTCTNFDPRAWSRAHRTDGLSFAVDGTPVVIFNLSVPLACVAVSCDDAFAHARATARPT